VKVGYPVSPNTENAESLLRYYTLVKIGKFDYFNNMLSARYEYFINVLLSYVTEEHE
jgi:endothelin-converting enzyme